MAKIVVDKFYGLAPAGTERYNMRPYKPGYLEKGGYDILTYPGYISGAWVPVTNLDSNGYVNSTLTAYTLISPSNNPPSNSGQYYYIGGARIHTSGPNNTLQLDDSTYYANFPVAITGTGAHSGHNSFVASDIVVHKATSSGTRKVFVSYNDNTDGDVAVCALDGTGYDGAFMSATAASGATLSKNPHPLLSADNGFLYIGDGPSIHKYDSTTGTNGTFTASAIDLPVSWTILDLMSFKGYCWVVAIQGAYTQYADAVGRRLGIFLWNYQSRNSGEFSGFEKGTPYIIDGVTNHGGIFIHNGIPHIFARTADNRSKLYRFTGSEFSVVWDEPGDIIPLNKYGISKYMNNIIWASRSDGTIYAFGTSIFSASDTFSVLGSCYASGAGILVNGFNYVQWVSYGNNSFKALATQYGPTDFETTYFDLPKLSVVNGLTLFYWPINDVSGTTMNIAYYKNYSQGAAQTIYGTHQIINADDAARGFKYFQLGGAPFSNVSSIKIYVGNSSGNNGVFPRFYRMEIDYTPTDRLK
jgi:hypothetical protein